MTEIGIVAVGGYNEMGRNMTAIIIGEDIVILDMGLRLDRVQIHEDVEIDKMHSLELIEMGAIPDDTIMKEINGTVRAIVCTHGHLDHIGAIPKLAHRYNAPPILATPPYTAAIIRQQIESERKFEVCNRVIPLQAGGTYQVTEDISIEFIRSSTASSTVYLQPYTLRQVLSCMPVTSSWTGLRQWEKLLTLTASNPSGRKGLLQ